MGPEHFPLLLAAGRESLSERHLLDPGLELSVQVEGRWKTGYVCIRASHFPVLCSPLFPVRSHSFTVKKKADVFFAASRSQGRLLPGLCCFCLWCSIFLLPGPSHSLLVIYRVVCDSTNFWCFHCFSENITASHLDPLGVRYNHCGNDSRRYTG